MIFKYRPFPRNIDSLGDRGKNNFLGKNQFFEGDLNNVLFPEILIVLEIEPKNDLLGKNQGFQGDLKESFFSSKY